MSAEASAAELDAAAELHHQLFTGLLLSLAGHHGRACAAALVERTFRRQHDERFLPGLARLGLAGLPPADACARYIYLANRAGGVDVEYVPDGPRKAWVRYPPPRWAYEGAAICALDDGVTEAFLRGFHARCGDSLGVPGLRFVCTGMTTAGDPGLEGYFEDTGEALAPAQRLVFRRGLAAPPFDPARAPALPWDAARAALARRNYAVRYIELMLPALADLLGDDVGGQVARRAAHLVGLQLYRDTAARLGVRAGSRERPLERREQGAARRRPARVPCMERAAGRRPRGPRPRAAPALRAALRVADRVTAGAGIAPPGAGVITVRSPARRRTAARRRHPWHGT